MDEIDITELWNKSVAEIGDCTYAKIITRFAEHVAIAEREACAKVCETTMTDTILGSNKEYNTGREMGATVCANKIRMRSNTP